MSDFREYDRFKNLSEGRYRINVFGRKALLVVEKPSFSFLLSHHIIFPKDRYWYKIDYTSVTFCISHWSFESYPIELIQCSKYNSLKHIEIVSKIKERKIKATPKNL